MQQITAFVILAVLAMTSFALDHISYEGLRLDMSAATLNRDILSIIIPALNRTLESHYNDIKEPGSFWTELHLKGLKIINYKINEERIDITRFEYNAPIYKMKGSFESILFHISFEFLETWLGIKISSGHGVGIVTNVNNEILVFFNESDPDIAIPHPWDIKNLTLASWSAPTKWVHDTLHKHFIPVFHKVVDDSMWDFAHLLLRTYRRIEDVFPHDVDLIFMNDIISVKPTVGGNYLSIAFKTNITVNNYIHKKMYRRMNGTVVPRGDFDYCFAAQLVPDVLDALGKGGYYDSEVPYWLWGFNEENMTEIFNIMPNLRTKYFDNDTFGAHCQSTRFETVLDLDLVREFIDPPLALQNPTYCFFYAHRTGEYFLLVDIFLRTYYEMKATNQSYIGHIPYCMAYSFRTLPELPEVKKNLFGKYVDNFAAFFSESEMLSPGIKVVPNRHLQLNYTDAYITDDEICFYYNEIKPVVRNN